ncbi:hypothetical protein BTA51_14515 [Hahella sp. CCB-MM4]|uniref:substrate-binding periplasmic protein n=1 Tax=Hahella sp. (strain CCB-MM4) TaxID=1926491 RepID=UPI000BDA569E|nr:transporter substrate-binding domain-containing protein [Hahella sp. CCB-MM4]OZG72733.1 hypothetical protein BTA51_14515 [Hahella sp. CCB-MM4]
MLKKVQLFSVFAFLALITLQTTTTAYAKDGTPHYPGRAMSIAFADNYPPFSWQSDDNEVKGILRDFLHELLENRMGLKVEFHIYPWARGQKLVKDGLADAFFTIPNADRLTYTKASKLPIFTSDYYMYTGKNNPNLELLKGLHTLQELKEQKQLTHAYIVGGGWHGVHLGDVAHKWVEQDSKRILMLLELNRADVYIEQRPLMNYQMKLLGYKGEIVEVPNMMDVTNWHLCIGDKSPFLVILPELDRTMAEMTENKELDTLREEVFSSYR